MKGITIDRKLMDRFESLESRTVRDWEPTGEQRELIVRYWGRKNHADFISMFKSVYPDAPVCEKTYRRVYQQMHKEAK